jgi:hypothetical protein
MSAPTSGSRLRTGCNPLSSLFAGIFGGEAFTHLVKKTDLMGQGDTIAISSRRCSDPLPVRLKKAVESQLAGRGSDVWMNRASVIALARCHGE